MTIGIDVAIWIGVHLVGLLLVSALLWWRFGDWYMTPRTKQGRLVRIVARSALIAISIFWLYFIIALLFAVTLIYWRETGNEVWLSRWRESFAWVLITLGALVLLLVLVAVAERWLLDREVRRQLAEENLQAATSAPPWDGVEK